MAKGKNRRDREDREPKQKKTTPIPPASFNKELTFETKPKAKKD
ncbi:hypothetical protein [Roseibium suaedae]|uniref:Uncharacterized protein n=1 Tax=Roseibium suaedae TaxID=735517 RepID=A0A1M7PHX8_9HYPH|nr:hypothetical protein [Roseibium suaedae]SHN16728.1 hypothetical protein SAMN05444272_4424 [Roseibium suaedae]